MRHMEEQKRMEFYLLEKEGQGMSESIQKSMKRAKKKEAETGDWKKWELKKLLGKCTDVISLTVSLGRMIKA